MKKYKRSIFIFRRDLRIFDNTALSNALEQSEKVLVCFILDDRQFKNNDYKSDNAVEFMINSLIDLEIQIKNKGGNFFVFSGIAEKVVEELLERNNFEAVFINRDYTPFSRLRDRKISEICQKKQKDFCQFADILLTETEQVRKKDGLPYLVFTPFYKKASQVAIKKPRKSVEFNFFTNRTNLQLPREIDLKKLKIKKNIKIWLSGGRKEALELLNKVENLKNYQTERNLPFVNKTSFLSAHNKFGTVSIREVYYKIKNDLGLDHELIKQLYWRDFFTQIAQSFPRVFGNNFKSKLNQIQWKNNLIQFEKWKKGETGFPFIDAGMRQLNQTGYMHNRVRMIVASFLVKNLQIDWQLGEKYFAQKLIDYDPCVNNGSWQWAASTGCDAVPYFRIFNPFRQQKRFDSECLYVKKWIPKLRNYSCKQIMDIEKGEELRGYFPKMIDYKKSVIEAKKMYQAT